MPYNVLLVDDHKLMRDGVKTILERVADFKVLAEAETGTDAWVARLTGSTVPLTGPTWPMVRHYNPDDFENQCGNPCNPTSGAPPMNESSSVP